MIDAKELQKDEMYLPGGLGTVLIGGHPSEIKAAFFGKDGSTTLTISPVQCGEVVRINSSPNYALTQQEIEFKP